MWTAGSTPSAPEDSRDQAPVSRAGPFGCARSESQPTVRSPDTSGDISRLSLSTTSEVGSDTARPRSVRRYPARMAGLAPPDLAVFVVLAVAFAILRGLAVWHRVPALYPDTDTYRPPPGGLPYSLLSFAGHAPRMWGLPLLYRLLPSDRARMIFQLGASIVAWLALAGAIASVVKHRALRIVAFVAALLLGLAPEVAAWDQSLLSESLTISVSVGAATAWLRFAVRPAVPAAVVGLLLTGCLLFIRPFQSPIALGIAALCAIWALRGHRRALKFSVAGLLVALSIWSTVTSSRVNDGYRLRGDRGVSYFAEAFQQNLYKRYLKNAEATAWFHDHGMPDPTGLTAPSVTGPFYGDFRRGRVFYKEVRSRPQWLHWLDGRAKSALAGYVIIHPGHVVAQFLSESPPMIRSAVLPAGFGKAVDPVRFEPIPSAVNINPFFRGSSDHPWQNDVAALGLVALALGVVIAQRHRRPNWPALVVGSSMILVGVGSLFENWLGSAIEMIRHAVPPVTVLRVGLIITVVTLADATLRRSPPPPDGTGERPAAVGCHADGRTNAQPSTD